MFDTSGKKLTALNRLKDSAFTGEEVKGSHWATGTITGSRTVLTSLNSTWTDNGTYYTTTTVETRTSIITRFKIWFREWRSGIAIRHRKRVFNPNAFFKAMKKSMRTNKEIRGLNKAKVDKQINDMRDRAKATGQTAFAEKLEKDRKRIHKELDILKAGFKYYVDEKDIVSNKSKLPAELKMTEIKNYVRFIPLPVLQALMNAIDKKVFSNFIIMHYDPNDDGEQMTKKEVEKAKDPILFGVAKHSRKLFFIADWIDEYCNFTLDKLLASLEKDESEAIISVDTIVNDG